MSEVAFAICGIVGQRMNVPPITASFWRRDGPGRTADVPMLAVQPPEDLLCGVPLLGRSLLVGQENPVDDGLERVELRGRRILGAGVALRLGTGQGFPNRNTSAVCNGGAG